MRYLLAVLLVVAIWRVTRLLVLDEFPPVRRVRHWFIGTFGVVDAEGSIIRGRHWGIVGWSLAYIWTCPWCMSPWVGAVIVALADWRLSVPYPWLLVAAGSALSGVMAMVEGRHEQRVELAELQLKGLRK